MVYLSKLRYNYNVRKQLLDDLYILEETGKTCDHPQCDNLGEHRAPKTRALNDYYLFCQEHARAYNLRWDYYRGMNSEEIEQSRWQDYTWNRPTWAFGKNPIDFKSIHEKIKEFQEGFEAKPETEAASPYQRDLQQALIVLGFRQKPKTFAAVQNRYKELAKQFHPDANKGDPDKENRLKDINQAYTFIRQFKDFFTI